MALDADELDDLLARLDGVNEYMRNRQTFDIVEDGRIRRLCHDLRRVIERLRRELIEAPRVEPAPQPQVP